MASENIVTELNRKNVLFTSLIAGGLAGSFVDATLFPIDTLKTRLQSKNGLWKSGSFKGLYKGIFPVLVGSAPTAAVFFVTYDGIKSISQPFISEKYHSFVHMGAASLAESVACLIRVPVEVMKQRKQALLSDKVFYNFHYGNILRRFGVCILIEIVYQWKAQFVELLQVLCPLQLLHH
ncbi:hypothetical protein KM043_018629 [Ampulex compressa]|nr:hypothetical protein KM043_018629 [Ampulex compressa]